MNNIIKKIKSRFEQILLSPWHFVLLSIYFVFRMYDFNIYQVPFQDFIRPLFFSVLAGLGLYQLFGRFAAQRWHTAALMTSMWLTGFFLYGTFWDLVSASKVIRQPQVFAVLWGLFFIGLIIWLGWKIPKSPSPTVLASVNLMAISLLLSAAIGSVVYFISFQIPFPSKTNHTVQGHPLESYSDIYYIILDAYTRADVLAKEFGHDNEPFVRSLQDLGFYVAECSQSNYEMTPLSLTASLNLDYVQNMSDTFKPDSMQQMGLVKLLDDNNVQETVSNFGYKTVAFSSGYLMAEWRDADVFLSPPYGPITEFEVLLLSSTYLRIFDDMNLVNFDDLRAERYRTRTRLILDSFDDLIAIPGPKFVFIHLIIPHEPFAFDAVGNPIPPDPTYPKHGYSDQVKFINSAILPKLEQLIEESPTPPVIILQGDHGTWLLPDHSAQLKILNAYYLPKGSEALYPSISPVNSFRLVFNEYFDAGLPLLEDRSYHSTRFRMFRFTPARNTCP